MEGNWKPVVGWEGHYSVSDLGRVRRDADGQNARKGRVLKGGITTAGYANIVLCDGWRRHTYTIHCLIALAFIGPRPPGMQINHKNGIKTDNRLENLEFVTPSENQKHARRTGLNHGPIGESSSFAILAEADVLQIKASLARGERQSALGRRFGVSQSIISDIGRGKTWRHVA